MTTEAEDDAAPSFRFKRRKTAHTKRARVDEDARNTADNPVLDAAVATDAPEAAHDEEESAPNLKEILRNRKRPRDRLKEAARKTAEPSSSELAQVDAPRADKYTSRFVVQTGQVVDSSDAQMNIYVEARLAEQNHRNYGWPIPSHLRSTVAAIAPDLNQSSAEPPTPAAAATPPADEAEHRRTAAGQGKLEEVTLAPDTARTHKAWNPPPAPKVRLGRNGKPFRSRKRRSSSDARRDAAVDAVLREAKIEYFDATPAAPRFAVTDEDMLEQFRSEYYEAAEERQARKPTMPVPKDQPKGPKLGGSRSARAAMRGREEMAAKGAKR